MGRDNKTPWTMRTKWEGLTGGSQSRCRFGVVAATGPRVGSVTLVWLWCHICSTGNVLSG
jgi:hypothetical protein